MPTFGINREIIPSRIALCSQFFLEYHFSLIKCMGDY